MGLISRISTNIPDVGIINNAMTYANAALRLKYLPNVRRPKTFNEVILSQRFSKRFDSALAAEYTCKRNFKELIAKQLNNHIIPTLLLTKSKDELRKFLEAHDQSVIIKPTHSSGKYLLRRSGQTLSSDEFNAIQSWLSEDYFLRSREPNYRGLEPYIIVEPLLMDGDGIPPKDYKVFVYEGRAKAIQVDVGRFSSHSRLLMDRSWKKLGFSMGYDLHDHNIPKPHTLDELITVSEKISGCFQFVRVDFLCWDDNYYIGELTFFPGNGAERFTEASADRKFGELIRDG